MQRRFKIMGILNVTPDSFSDGGKFLRPEDAVTQAAKMIEDGADLIDIGGESTRPGSKSVSQDEEMARVMPVIEAIKARFETIISLDTSKPSVMAEGIRLGVDWINDVLALQEEGALEVVAKSKVKVCLMHMQGKPRTMQVEPVYHDVVAEVGEFFKERLEHCLKHGIASDRVVLDPGVGFGKTLAHNLEIVRNLSSFSVFGCPILIGVSRKSLIGQVTGAKIHERLPGSLALAAYAAGKGARYFRVHDVKATRQALDMLAALEQ